MVVDDNLHILYLGDGYPGSEVRAVDLTTGIITLVGGSGSVDADGQLATSVSLSSPGGLSVASDGSLFLVTGFASSGTRIRKIDHNTGIINTVLAPTSVNCATAPLTVQSVSSGNGGSSTTATDAAGNLYFFGGACGGSYPNGATGILKYTPGGVLSVVAVQPVAGWCPNQLTSDAVGNLYFTDYCSSGVFAVDTAGNVTTVVQPDPSPGGPSADYTDVSQLLLNYPWGVSLLPGGHLAIADSNNASVRIIW
jgi:hypothetical protein